MTKKIPPWIVELYGSARRFRAEKRAALDEVLELLDLCRTGCGWHPEGGSRVHAAYRLLKQERESLSVANWGK